MSKGSNLPAIERATGISWDSWVEHLDGQHAANLPHRSIAQLAEQHLGQAVGNSSWWAQGVAVAYEQHIGRRLPGQAADGSFQFSVTRTVSADLDGTLEQWQKVMGTPAEINGWKLDGGPRISRSDKWRYWRIGLEDGTRVSVDIGRKGEKSSIAVNHTKIQDPDQVPLWKDYWRSLLDQLPG